MPVYVDDMQAPLGRLILCHMIADSSLELFAMVRKIGVQTKWIQQAGTTKEHFDIALGKRALAVRQGATEITWRQCGAMIKRLEVEGILGKPDDAEKWLHDWHSKKRKTS